MYKVVNKTQPASSFELRRTKMADREESEKSRSIKVCGMQFAYERQPPLFYDFNLDISPGSRCLLVGANGSGNLIQISDFYLNISAHEFFTYIHCFGCVVQGRQLY